jgi:hypothetical protein
LPKGKIRALADKCGRRNFNIGYSPLKTSSPRPSKRLPGVTLGRQMILTPIPVRAFVFTNHTRQRGTMATKKKLFLASSRELEEDRKEFEIFINRKNKDWVDKGVFLELVVWEDFLDAVSKTRLQDEYNKEIRQCDIFVMLFWTKVGRYTEEEFETAVGQFKATSKPFIFTYFKDAEISTGSLNKKDLMSLWAFQEKLRALGHFYTIYENIDDLKSLLSGNSAGGIV